MEERVKKQVRSADSTPKHRKKTKAESSEEEISGGAKRQMEEFTLLRPHMGVNEKKTQSTVRSGWRRSRL